MARSAIGLTKRRPSDISASDDAKGTGALLALRTRTQSGYGA